MRASLAAVAFALIALVVGCSQPASPTVPSGNPFTGSQTSLTTPSGDPFSRSQATNLAGGVAAGKEIPFKGRLEGVVTITPLTPPSASVLIEGTGTASHLGRFTVEVPHLVNQAARTGAGTYEFTAANGDTLTADFTGEATLTSPGVLSIEETATITGGTGRFAGATGSFSSQRLFHTATLTTAGSFEGTISSPGN